LWRGVTDVRKPLEKEKGKVDTTRENTGENKKPNKNSENDARTNCCLHSRIPMGEKKSGGPL